MAGTITVRSCLESTAAQGNLWRSRLAMALLLTFLAPTARGSPAPDSGAVTPLLRIAFTTRMMGPINESDAKAAIKAWARTVLKTRDIPGEAAPLIVDTAGLVDGFRSGQLDLATMSTEEFFILSEQARTAHVFFGNSKGGVGEEYVLLVQDANPTPALAPALAALRGARLEIYHHHAATLGADWLDVLLIRERLPELHRHFGKVTHRNKLSSAVLPVFFGAADACVVTRRGFETMVELNPQLGKRLKVLATSPRLVGSLFCFNADFASELKERVLRALAELHESPAGHQILTIFQTDALQEYPDYDFSAERALLRERAEGRLGTGHVVEHPPGAPPSGNGQ